MVRHICGIAMAACFGLAGVANATTLVDWGSANYVTTTQDLVVPAATFVTSGNTRTGIYVYDTVTSSAPSSDYTVPPGKSGIFYTGSYLSQNFVDFPTTTQGWSAQQVRSGSPSDDIYYFRGAWDNTSNWSGASFISFLKSDFLDGGSSQSDISFGDGSEISLTVSASTFATFYFAVLDGDQWYISQTGYTAPGIQSLSGAALQSEMWGAWDPTGGENSRLGDLPGSYDVNTSSFTNLAGFGVVTSYLAPVESLVASGISNFSVTVVPEPATLALVALGGMAVLFRRRKTCTLSGNR